jgi:hypothetical protein
MAPPRYRRHAGICKIAGNGDRGNGDRGNGDRGNGDRGKARVVGPSYRALPNLRRAI